MMYMLYKNGQSVSNKQKFHIARHYFLVFSDSKELSNFNKERIEQRKVDKKAEDYDKITRYQIDSVI